MQKSHKSQSSRQLLGNHHGRVGRQGLGVGVLQLGSPGTKLLNKTNHTEHNSSISFIPHSHTAQAHQLMYM